MLGSQFIILILIGWLTAVCTETDKLKNTLSSHMSYAPRVACFLLVLPNVKYRVSLPSRLALASYRV